MPDTLTKNEIDGLLKAVSAADYQNEKSAEKILTEKDARILIVDDAAFMRMMQKDILEKNGYTICGEAADGIEAIDKYKELKPDLVVLDITMPNMDGLTAQKEIKKFDPEAKILMVSAMGQEPYVVDSIRNGASDFIVKPFQADKFLAGVYAVLTKKMPVIPEEHINDWHRHKKYPENHVLTQEQIDELILSYILFAQNLNTDKTDSLTKCLAVSAFDYDFMDILKEAGEKYEDVTLVMTDIDNFKRVNDSFGHETGDKVLKEIGKVLLEIPTDHKTYRYSGDSFVLVFPNIEKERVFLIMEEARKKVAEIAECSNTGTTISVGIATYLEDGSNDIEIIRKAEGALYRAKESGRNKIALAKEEKLVTKTAHFTVEQLKRLEKLAKERVLSEAVLMREALDELLKKYNN